MHVDVRTQRPSVVSFLDPVRMLRNLWSQRELVLQLTTQEVAQRYKGSYLGMVWSFVTPVLMLLVYAFVFSIVFEARWGSGSGGSQRPGEFALTLFAGLIPFNVFAEVVTKAPSVVLGVPNYVKKVVFPLEILPVVAVGAALAHSVISVGILVVASAALAGYVSPAILLLPLAYLPLVLLVLGLGWFVASLGVYLRDVGQVIGVITQVLLFVSPIFYPVTAVPDRFRVVLYVNPLTTILDGFRRTILWGNAPAWGAWAGLTALAAALALLGYAWFMQTKKGFPDVM